METPARSNSLKNGRPSPGHHFPEGNDMSNAVSLTPGFSPVMVGETCQNRFNGFPRASQPLNRFTGRCAANTRLKPGVNEKHWMVAPFARHNR